MQPDLNAAAQLRHGIPNRRAIDAPGLTGDISMLKLFRLIRPRAVRRPAGRGALVFRFYLVGYRGLLLPRRFRRLIAGNSWHRAWLAGAMGLFEQDGVRHGVCSRHVMFYRKGPDSEPVATLSRAFAALCAG